MSTGRAGSRGEPSCPPEIAQQLHDEIVQRLCGVAAALGSDGRLRAADRIRCRVELEAALAVLRTLLNGDPEPLPPRPFRTVAEAVRAACEAPGGRAVRLRVTGDAEVSVAAGQLVADFVVEAIRNAVKHGRARSIALTVRAGDDAVRVDVFNDGIASPPGGGGGGGSGRGGGAGAGLRLLAARAREHGGCVSSRATSPDGWTTTLTLPRRPRAAHAFGSPTRAGR